MTLTEKQEVIKKNKDEAIAALDRYLDCLYNTTEAAFDEEGVLKSNLSISEKAKGFLKELKDDEIKYEKVRRKILDGDFNLSLTEINLVALSFMFASIRMEKMVENYQKAREDLKVLIESLMSKNEN